MWRWDIREATSCLPGDAGSCPYKLRSNQAELEQECKCLSELPLSANHLGMKRIRIFRARLGKTQLL